ncbi:hypothetical protein M758_6G193100 [Ceratodon purpureus]|uniref:Uncharacterized protein n=1 Tax=Ceratodon purpureus TaxID=3225 RepID=A0A8T0HJL3_CERPU|nr:hypothetical protein KC19_6G201700 [Ceratodon purpureus]KAG0614652.1 hypothetical protein M758_6G193100 [Ceratodon purpureus]
MAQGRRSRCECTLPFSLHLTVMILGVIGIILTIVATVLVAQFSSFYKTNGTHGAAVGSVIWLLLTTVLIFVSGLQGILMRDSKKWHLCFVILAVIILVDLGVLIVAFIFIASPFWIIYMIAVFVMELWVLCLRTCCKPKVVDMTATELPVANPGAAQEYSVDMSQQGYPSTYQNNGFKAPYPGY